MRGQDHFLHHLVACDDAVSGIAAPISFERDPPRKIVIREGDLAQHREALAGYRIVRYLIVLERTCPHGQQPCCLELDGCKTVLAVVISAESKGPEGRDLRGEHDFACQAVIAKRVFGDRRQGDVRRDRESGELAAVEH